MRRPPGSGIIDWAARLVPASERATWRREWLAEMAYAWQQIERSDQASPWSRLRLRIRTLNCIIDALWERKQTMKMTGLMNDLRYALRSLLRRPGFTAIAVVTLGLGIGASTAVFTLVDGVLLQALPFEDSSELLSIRHQGRGGQDQLPMSPGLYVLYRNQATTLDGIGLYTRTAANIVADGQPERIEGQAVTPSFFEVLGSLPALGRTFSEAEGAPDGADVVMLSDGLWRSRYGSDPTIVGQRIEISGRTREVVGIMPPDFGIPDQSARFWLPLVIDEAQAPLASFFALGVARAADGRSLDAVRRELSGLTSRLEELFPGDESAFLSDVGLEAQTTTLKEDLVGPVQTTLWVLLGTVGFVLLIACANVANLLLVRAEGRQREMALRVAVGAGRLQVLRSFMGESLVLGVLGGALGVGLAGLSIKVTTAFIPSDLPRMNEIGMDVRVLAFAALLVLGSVIFFGLFPMLKHGADDLAVQLRDGGGARGATGGKQRHRLRSGLVVTQVALALVLLVGSGLMFRSFQALRAVNPGFDPAGTLTARITVPGGEIEGALETDEFFQQLQDRLAEQPGVIHVGLVNALPLSEAGVSFSSIEVEDHPRGPQDLPVFAALPQAGPGYMEAMNIRLLEGRTFERGDGGMGTRAVVASRSFAEEWWPQTSALGRRLRFGATNEDWYQIVGVVENVRQDGLEQPIQPAVYFPTLTEADGQLQPSRVQDVVIRTTGDPLDFIPVLRRELNIVNPRIPMANARLVQSVFNRATAQTSFTMTVLGAASGIALILGLVGIYGVISYVVSQRTREIGVRMALGANASSVRRMVVGQGMTLAAIGVGVGLAVAVLASRVMGSLLFGVSATDPVTYLTVAVALVAVAIVASWIPALRAAGVDPSRALRAD